MTAVIKFDTQILKDNLSTYFFAEADRRLVLGGF